MDVRQSAAFAHHVLVYDGSHTWLHTAWGRSAPPIDLGEVTFPEHPFAPNGRSFITLTAQRPAAQPERRRGAADVPIANAADRTRVVIHRDGSRAALCAPDGPVACTCAWARNPTAQELAAAVCTGLSRPTLTRTSADVVTLDETASTRAGIATCA
jgi:hypothetical protein